MTAREAAERATVAHQAWRDTESARDEAEAVAWTAAVEARPETGRERYRAAVAAREAAERATVAAYRAWRDAVDAERGARIGETLAELDWTGE
jgi:hypothetical protein